MSGQSTPSFLQQLTSITQNYGVFGLGLGMFFESLGIPFASALVALTAGTLIATGKTSFWEVLLITTTGLTMGSLVSYYIGFWGGKLGRYFSNPCQQEQSGRFTKQYKRWGELSVLFAQLFGTTRTWVSLPAGAMKMKLQRFILYTAVGGAIYCALAIGFSMILATLLSQLTYYIHSTVHLVLTGIALVTIAGGTLCYARVRQRCQGGGEEQSTE